MNTDMQIKYEPRLRTYTQQARVSAGWSHGTQYTEDVHTKSRVHLDLRDYTFNEGIVLKTDRRLGRAVDETSVKFQSDLFALKKYPAASSLCEIWSLSTWWRETQRVFAELSPYFHV